MVPHRKAKHTVVTTTVRQDFGFPPSDHIVLALTTLVTARELLANAISLEEAGDHLGALNHLLEARGAFDASQVHVHSARGVEREALFERIGQTGVSLEQFRRRFVADHFGDRGTGIRLGLH